MLIYENTEDLNALGGHCHHMMVKGFWYTLGEGLSEEMKLKIAQMQMFGLLPKQIMSQHTKEVRELAMELSYMIHFYCHQL